MLYTEKYTKLRLSLCVLCLLFVCTMMMYIDGQYHRKFITSCGYAIQHKGCCTCNSIMQLA